MKDTETDWTKIGPRGHAVQFYEHDDALAGLLAAYIGTALVKGEAAVVIATKKHRDELRARLAQRGMDLAVAQAAGRFESLDAAETLSTFCGPDGWPDAVKFNIVAGEIFERLTRAIGRGPTRISAFGEMVALLCSSGQFAAAVRLEELWNDLLPACGFSLCCAYPMNLFKANETAAARFLKVCAQHSHVFPAERRSEFSGARSSAL